MHSSPTEQLTTRQQLLFLFGGWTVFISSLLILAGHDVWQSVGAATMAAGQFTAGFILWRVSTKGAIEGFIAAAAFGAALGSVLSTLSGIVLVSTVASPVAWSLPVFGALGVIRRLTPIERVPDSSLRWLLAASVAGLSTEWTWLLPVSVISVVIAGSRWLPKTVIGTSIVVLGTAQWWLLDKRTPYWSQFRQGLTEVADYSYLESVARGTAQWAHLDNVLMAGTRLGYHWLSYSWAGRITETVDSTGMAFSSHLIQICFIPVAVALIYVSAMRLGAQQPWAVLAAFTFALVTAVPMGLFQALSAHSPSQPFATAMLLGTLLVVSIAGSIGMSKVVPVLVLLAIGVVGGKIAAVPAMLVGVAVFAVLEWRKRRDPSPVVSFVALTVVALIGFVYFYGNVVAEGQTGSTRFGFLDVVYTEGPLGHADRTALLTALGLVAVLAGIVGVVPGVVWFRRLLGQPSAPLAWMFVGAAVVSFAIGLVYVGESSGVPYFFNVGIAVLIPVSSAGISQLHSRTRRGVLTTVILCGFVLGVAVPSFIIQVDGEGSVPSVARSVLLVVPVLVGSLVMWFGGSRAKSLAAVLVLVSALASYAAWVPRFSLVQARHGETYVGGVDSISGSPETRSAAEWLRQNSDPSDIIAVNRFCNVAEAVFPDCPAYWNVVSSITGRRMYVENLDWTARSASGSTERALEVLRFVNEPTAETADFLETANVSWVFVDKAVTAQESWEPWAEVMFENEDALVLQVASPGSRE